MDWHRTSDGTYVAPGTVRPGDTFNTTRSWHVFRGLRGSWVIESVKTVHQPGPHSLALPPLSVTAVRHGDAHTLREAKELVASGDLFLSYNA